MTELTRYGSDTEATIDIPITREDAIDLANEKLRCGAFAAAGFYFEIALALDVDLS